MTISPEAVQAALDAFFKPDGPDGPCMDMQAALEAAFPIMLREVANETLDKMTWASGIRNYKHRHNRRYAEWTSDRRDREEMRSAILALADSFSGEGG